MTEVSRNRALCEAFRKRASELVGKMTLEEKISQTLHAAPAIARLGIPEYNLWNEALHGVARAGVATVFPQAIGLAATFDEDLIEEVADAISTEGRAKYNMQQKYGDEDVYKGLTFWSPNINIFRDPRWGRGHETFGEDPYLTSRMGVRFVEGLQGHDEKYLKAAACVKHFAVHSGPESLRHSFDAAISKQDLRETYLPAFEACVKEAKVEGVMGAYNRVNGQPCCGHSELLIDILRGEWGFEGHVVSDCGAIRDFHEGHGVTSTEAESAAMAMRNGCDINCGDMFHHLKEAVERGLVTEARIDEALINLFTTKMKLGFFDPPEDNPFWKIPYSVVDSKEMKALNLKAAEKSIVLLKNEGGLLPLKKESIKTLGVIGPNANSRDALVGNYMGTASEYRTVLEGLQEYLGEDVRVMTSEGCHLYRDKFDGMAKKNDRLAEVKGVCAESDVVIACLGLDASLEGEEGDAGNGRVRGDKTSLDLPGNQQAILEAMYDSGKPVILVLLSGSALAVTWASEHIPAIIEGWYPGAQGGRAIARLLFGEKCPEGRLPITFYRTMEELPAFTDYSMKGRTYRYMQNEALYPFGYGLSYTEFRYDSVSMEARDVRTRGVDLKAAITNCGQYDGAECVQIYVKLHHPHTPNAQLKAFQKVFLKAGERKNISIHLPPEAFGLYNEDGVPELRSGDATVYIGGQAPDSRSEKLTGRTVYALSCTL